MYHMWAATQGECAIVGADVYEPLHILRRRSVLGGRATWGGGFRRARVEERPQRRQARRRALLGPVRRFARMDREIGEKELLLCCI